jgi:CMP/dCMP kinase
MYRAVVLAALDTGTDLDDARALAGLGGLATRMTGDPRLRTPTVDARVSQVAGHAAVRAAMRDAQRRFLEEGDTVVEGRDIGAVVWPESELKVWLDADPVERARRRIDESGDASAAQALHTRDQRDAQQTLRAPDAVLVDSTELSAGAVVDRIVELAREHGAC